MLEVSVVCPMYNEQAGIAAAVRQIATTLEQLAPSSEIVLVDDGSTDGTRAIARDSLGERGQVIAYAPNRGRGHALRAGFARARGRFILATEADLSWGASVLADLLVPLREDDADVTIASPYAAGGRLEGVPCGRELLSRGGNLLLGRKFGVTMATGMTRGYRREALGRLSLSADDKDLHVEILAEARRHGLRIAEVPAVLRWSKDRNSRRSLKLRHVVRHLRWALG